MKGFFVTGTDTGIGKTEVSGYLARMFFRKGFKVGVMKPVATGVEGYSHDARILKRMAHSSLPLDYINPVSLRLPLSPFVASEIEEKPIEMASVWIKFEELKKTSDILIVEGVGGIMVPVYRYRRKIYYVLDIIKRMKLPVIIVSRPTLGTINHTLMTVSLLKLHRIKIEGIIFSYTSRIKTDLSVKTNPGIVERLSGVEVLGIMFYNRVRKKRRVRWLKDIEL